MEPDFIAKKLRCSVTLQATTIKDSATNLVRTKNLIAQIVFFLLLHVMTN